MPKKHAKMIPFHNLHRIYSSTCNLNLRDLLNKVTRFPLSWAERLLLMARSMTVFQTIWKTFRCVARGIKQNEKHIVSSFANQQILDGKVVWKNRRHPPQIKRITYMHKGTQGCLLRQNLGGDHFRDFAAHLGVAPPTEEQFFAFHCQ